jgi:predicted dehydrogenase
MADDKSEEDKGNFNRRTFIGALVGVGAGAVLASCQKSYVNRAPDGPLLKAGLVGCGERGTGAAQQFLKAGPHLQVVALGDVLPDRLNLCRDTLTRKSNQKISDDHCFIGFDAYKKVLETEVDVVLLATPPHFRPLHFDAAVDAKKHCFIEKPCAVDAPGVRSILATGQKAKTYNLCVVAGTQRRHHRAYKETYARVSHGAIGQIVGASARWNQGQTWYRPRKKKWSDMEAMIRDWVNWRWLSGDHIVEQHVHSLDTVRWFTGMNPTQVTGGGRIQRVTGDQYDLFNLQFTYPHGGILESMCRQIDGCDDDISEVLVGTRGYTNCENTIYDLSGKVVWQYQERGQDPGRTRYSPYELEHVDFVTAIRTNEPLNEAEQFAQATLAAIMGRTAAYTGKVVKWDEMMDSNERLGPTEYAMGPVPIKAEVPVPGNATNIAKHART